VSYPRLIEWEDLDASTQGDAIRVLMSMTELGPSEAEDFVSEAVLRLMRLRPLVTNPRALLVRTALNLFYRARELEARGGPCASLDDVSADDRDRNGAPEPADEREDPASAVAEREAEGAAHSRLHRALARLRADDRARIEARYFEGQRLVDLERAEGHKEGTARSQLHRARERLLKAWTDSGARPGRTR
jgi:RNA polymerase sigma factor (sigma-70 family)